ncbi:hypothetical protein [Arcanobacterium hippocoleae]|uniref:hypothetical protein n=1 Tax=Arcanobacterium hippocoleae TaxID=149017 RepID=UPI00333F101F
MTILLAVVYASFISLGLPDAITGAAWPQIAQDLGIDAAGAGLLSLLISTGTIIASFTSGFLLKRFGTVKVSIFPFFSRQSPCSVSPLRHHSFGLGYSVSRSDSAEAQSMQQ